MEMMVFVTTNYLCYGYRPSMGYTSVGIFLRNSNKYLSNYIEIDECFFLFKFQEIKYTNQKNKSLHGNEKVR